MAEHDTEAVLDRVLQEAVEITGARYAALGILDENRSQLERFLTLGIDAATHRAIGDLPRGRGVLGVLIEDPQPLRLHRRRPAPSQLRVSRPATRRCTASSASRS